MSPRKRHIRQPSYQKSEVCVVNLRVAIFEDQRIEGFGEKGDWNTGIKTVFRLFGHLKIRFPNTVTVMDFFV